MLGFGQAGLLEALLMTNRSSSRCQKSRLIKLIINILTQLGSSPCHVALILDHKANAWLL
ncbi:MAG: hypothetical protein EBU26_12825 [Verrucomicrobia bacterium]|nr:hypothetical protein [Verrucomicrobiota bacterium]